MKLHCAPTSDTDCKDTRHLSSAFLDVHSSTPHVYSCPHSPGHRTLGIVTLLHDVYVTPTCCDENMFKKWRY